MQQLDALARGELAARVLRLDALPARRLAAPLPAPDLKLFQDFLHAAPQASTVTQP